jgi:hypothetical protein
MGPSHKVLKRELRARYGAAVPASAGAGTTNPHPDAKEA